MTDEQAEELAGKARAATREAEQAVCRAAASTPLTAQEVQWINEGASQQMRPRSWQRERGEAGGRRGPECGNDNQKERGER